MTDKKPTKAQIANTPDLWAEYVRTIKGEPFSLKDRPYLRPIYRCFGPDKKNVTVVLKCGRKVEKTETINNLLLYPSYNFKYFTSVYTTGRQELVSRFVNKRLDQSIFQSRDKCLVRRFGGGGATQKRFMTEKDIYNYLFCYSAWADAKSLLGIDGDFICIDEVQDMEEGFFPKIKEIVTQSKYKWFLLAGTARMVGSEFDKIWHTSSQQEWVVTCKHCGREQELTMENIKSHKNGRKYKGCVECNEILDTLNGKWVGKKPNARYIGFHLNQIIHVNITAEDIWDKHTDPQYKERLFQNEVLGEFYAGGLAPLTISMILGDNKWKGIAVDAPINYVGLTPPEESYMGIDWGAQTRVLILGDDVEIVKDEKGEDVVKDKTPVILNVFKIDTKREDEVAVITNLIDKYNVKRCVADVGYGHRQIDELQSKFKGRVRGCFYTNSPLNPFVYKKRNQQKHLVYMYVVDKTTEVEGVIDLIRRGFIRLPYSKDQKELEWMFDELTAIRSEAEESDFLKAAHKTPHPKYGRISDDHAFHALLYALIARRTSKVAPLSIRTLRF